MNKVSYLIFFLLICTILFQDCAKISQPTGGPKDTIPPELEFSVPLDASLNYRGRVIELKFDEFVKVENYRDQLIITPKYDGNIKAKANRYTVSIELEEPLDDSTTYTFTFRKSIVDITESNAPKNLTLAFSTGNFIDSISIEGKIAELTTNKIVENGLIGLYPVTDTLFLFEGPPTYFTETNEEGEYIIRNIRVGKYMLVALNDENENLIADSDVEAHGYIGDTLDLKESLTEQNMFLRILDSRPLELLSSRPSGKYFEVRFNKPIIGYDVECQDTLISHLIDERKIIRFYNPGARIDSISAIVSAYDTIGQEVKDTIMVKFPETKRDPDSFKTRISLNDKARISPEFEVEYLFDKPISQIVFDSLFFQYDSMNREQIGPEHIEWNKWKDILKLRVKLDTALFFKTSDTVATTSTSSKKYIKYFTGKGSFISVEGDTSESIKRFFEFKKATELGKISGTITTEHKSYIVQLQSSEGRVISELINPVDYTFSGIEPGSYRFRVLIDTNGDGKWEPGNILERIEPEPIFFYEKKIPIRANWEIYDENFSF